VTRLTIVMEILIYYRIIIHLKITMTILPFYFYTCWMETRNGKRGSGFCVTLCLRLSAIQFNTQ